MSAAARGSRTALVFRVVLPFVLYALARDVDAAVGVLLHSSLDLPDFVRPCSVPVEPRRPGKSRAHICCRWRCRLGRLGLYPFSFECCPFRRRPRCDGLHVRRPPPPSAPHVDGSPRARPPAHVSLRVHAARRAGPGPFDRSQCRDPGRAGGGAPSVSSSPRPGRALPRVHGLVAYALLTPESARRWEGHPGNEPKTLRMAVALGHGLTLDVEGVSAGMEALSPRPLLRRRADATRGLGPRVRAHDRGRGARSARGGRVRHPRHAHHAPDHPRQGGRRLHVLAPGPSLLLAPALRLDRALNLARGTPGRLAVTVSSGTRWRRRWWRRSSSSPATAGRERGPLPPSPAWPPCCRRFAVLCLPVLTPRCWARSSWPSRCARSCCGPRIPRRGPRPGPPARLPALAAPEVPARVGTARGDGGRASTWTRW